MSNYALKAYASIEIDVSQPARHVLKELADSANAKTGKCYPKTPKLMKRTGLSRSGLYKALAELRAEGWIEETVVEGDNWPPGRAPLLPGYLLIHPVLGVLNPPKSAPEPQAELPRPGGQDCPQHGQDRLPCRLAYKDKPEPKPEGNQRDAQRAALPPSQPQPTSVPDEITQQMRDHAVAEGLSEEAVFREHRKFKAKKREAGAKSFDWEESWVLWIERAVGHREHERLRSSAAAPPPSRMLMKDAAKLYLNRISDHARPCFPG